MYETVELAMVVTHSANPAETTKAATQGPAVAHPFDDSARSTGSSKAVNSISALITAAEPWCVKIVMPPVANAAPDQAMALRVVRLRRASTRQVTAATASG